MNDDPQLPEPDDEIARILELADGPRDLPPGEEERLLAQILEVEDTPRASAAEVDGGAGVVALGDERARRTSARPRRLVWAMAGFAAAVAAVVGVVTLRPSPAPPSVVDRGELIALDDALLCERTAALVPSLQLDRPTAAMAPAQADALRELVAHLQEVAVRLDAGALEPTVAGAADRIADTVGVAGLLASQLEAREFQDASRTRARLAALVVDERSLLESIGCAMAG